jgi:hypothetical protein
MSATPEVIRQAFEARAKALAATKLSPEARRRGLASDRSIHRVIAEAPLAKAPAPPQLPQKLWFNLEMGHLTWRRPAGVVSGLYGALGSTTGKTVLSLGMGAANVAAWAVLGPAALFLHDDRPSRPRASGLSAEQEQRLRDLKYWMQCVSEQGGSYQEGRDGAFVTYERTPILEDERATPLPDTY